MNLPEYKEGHLNTLRMLSAHGHLMGEAWNNYHRAIDQLIEAQELYQARPKLRSSQLSYQAALCNFEATISFIHESKDIAFECKINEWLP